MKREDLADFVIKNLVCLCLFIIFSFLVVEKFLSPKINDFQESRVQLRHAKILQSRGEKQNEQTQLQIQDTTKQNQAILASLKINTTANRIQIIARDFFKNSSVAREKVQTHEDSVEKFFKIQAQSNEIKPIFDFAKRIESMIPNATLILPLEILKKDPLMNTLDITLSLKIVQLRSTE